MFGEGLFAGFTPAPAIDLHAGNLYNVAISFLVFLACSYASWMIYSRGKRSASENSFSLFLCFMGIYWLLVAAGNMLAWLNLLSGFKWLVFPTKFFSVLPPIALAYYLGNEVFGSTTSARRFTFIYALVAVVYLFLTFRRDLAQSIVTYWGLQWQVGRLPFQVYTVGLLLPLAAAAVYLIINAALTSLFEGRKANTTLYLGGIIFVALEYIQLDVPVVTWQRLLARLFYILIAFSGYLYFAGRMEEKNFVPREEKAVSPKRMRVPFFAKLLFLFILLAVVPITISSLLLFVSFKEIIDLYIYKPLLWNLRTSREAFLMALTHAQIQALFLMALTTLLVVTTSTVVARSIADSLRRVSRGMEKVSRGDFSFQLLPDSNDEIGDVVNYFNNMSEEIKRARDVMENWNRELEVKVQERTEDLRVLYNISKAIGSSLDPELLISSALERVLPLLKTDVYALLVPDEKGKFSVRLCHGCDPKAVLLGEGQQLPGWITAPLRAKGKTMGILVIKGKEPNERAANLLATISDQLAVALENVGIYEKEREAVARLTELDRMKNEFISMVSHELRTPVTSGDGYVSLFLSGMAGPITEDQKKYLTVVKESNQRLLTLINRLLDFSQVETGRFAVKRELISLHEVIHSVMEMMKIQLENKHARLHLKLEARNSNIMGDREKMGEVLINLIENSLKFAREGKAPVIEISTRDTDDSVEVSVSDNGIGIEKEYLEKIFNKFYQIEETMTRNVGGVGLGLTLAKEIIGNHHGIIWAESEGKDKGARFIFSLPLAEKV